MTTCFQTLPFNIPKFNGHGSREPNHRQGKDENPGFPIYISSYGFQSRLPPISQLHADNIQKRKLPGNMSHLWSYGTPFLLKLLFSGNLPKAFYDEICNQNLPNKRNFNQYGTSDRVNSRGEIWEPKDFKRIRENGRRVDQRILEARLRQRHAERAKFEQKSEDRRKRTETVLLRKAGFMENGKRAYIEKMEKQSQKYKTRRGRLKKEPCTKSPCVAPSPENGVFVLTETKSK